MASLSSVRQGVALAVNLLCDAYMLGDAVDAYIQANDRGDGTTMLEKASVVNALALVGFSIAEIGGILSGKKSETLFKLKSAELVPRMVNLPLQFSLQAKDLAIKAIDSESIEVRDIVRLIQSGVVAPCADLYRTFASREAYCEQHFLDEMYRTVSSAEAFFKDHCPDMTLDQLKEARSLLIEDFFNDGPTCSRVVGCKPVDLGEYKKNVTSLGKKFEAATFVRVAAQAKIIEMGVCDLNAPTIQRLAAFCNIFGPSPLQPRSHERDGPDGTRTGMDHAPAPHDVERELDLNLLNYPNIPEPLHRDQVFRQYICPITQQPIRDPVRDPTNGMTLYERRAIVTWIQHSPTSPITGRPLRTVDLREAPVVRNQINRRLQQYQEELQRFLDMQASTPARD